MSASLRCFTTLALTVALLTAGLIAPAAGEPLRELPTTAAKTLEGLPAVAGAARTSQQVTAPMPFSMVGFKLPKGAAVQFRTSADGETWTDWTEAEVEPEEGPDPASAEGKAADDTATQPVWVGEATHIQTRLHGGRPTAHAGQVDVHLVDSSGLGRSMGQRVMDRLRAAWRGTPPAAEATVGRPPIVTRAQWGANESIRRGAPTYGRRINLGIVHHTAGSNSYTRAQADDVVRGVYSYHVRSNGWSDIGYNFLVDRFGTIYEGRYGGIARAVIGAHAGGFNTNSFGVSLMGLFDRTHPPAAMRSALRSILAWKYDLHHVNVLGSLNYTSSGSTKYSAGNTVRLRRLSGHRDVSVTSCPGSETYSMMPALRRAVAKQQGPVIFNPWVTPSSVKIVDGKSVSGALTFKARLRPAGTWTVTLRDIDGVLAHKMTGYGDTVSYQWLPVNVQPGRYRYTFSSPHRRAASGWVTLRAPAVDATASATTAAFGVNGLLKDPVEFTGSLWSGATWRLSVRDAAGVEVYAVDGSGASLAEVWEGPVTVPGTFSWRVTASDSMPATGSIQVYADHVERTAASSDAAVAASAISRRTFVDDEATTAVLTPAGRPNVALSAGSLAGTAGPVLFTGRDAMPAATLAELQRVLPPESTIHVLGDSSFVSDDIVAALDAEWTVDRVVGATPVAIAAEAAKRIKGRNPEVTTAIVVGSSRSGWRQAVAAGAYAAREGLPVLQTAATSVSPEATAAIADNGITNAIIVGNTTAVAPEVQDGLGIPSVRVGGDSAELTAVRVARNLSTFARRTSSSTDVWHFANFGRGDGWVRAVAAVPAAARHNAPLLGASDAGVPVVTKNYLAQLDYAPDRLGRGLVLGNRYHVSGGVRAALARQLQ